MASYEFVVTHPSHDNFRLKVESSLIGSSWSVEPASAECPLLSSGDAVVETSGDLVCRNGGTDLIVLESASFASEEGATGSAKVLQSACSEDGWDWLLDEKD